MRHPLGRGDERIENIIYSNVFVVCILVVEETCLSSRCLATDHVFMPYFIRMLLKNKGLNGLKLYCFNRKFMNAVIAVLFWLNYKAINKQR